MTPADCVLLSVDLGPLVPVSFFGSFAVMWCAACALDAYRSHLRRKP